MNTQFFFLNIRNDLPDQQHLAGSALLSFQTDNIGVFPLRNTVTHNITLKTQIVLVSQRCDDGLSAECLRKLPAPPLINHPGTELFQQLLIAPADSQIGRLRFCTRKILISFLLQIDHRKTGKQRIDTADDITHLPVFFLQCLFLPP